MNLPLSYKVIGIKLAKHRKSAKLTQRGVAERLGYESSQFISNIERGICAIPPELLKALIDLYSISPGECVELSSLLKDEFSAQLKKAVGI